MVFDLSKFESEQYRHREVVVAVPELTSFFPEGAPPEWKIRGLTGIETARVRESVQRANDLEAIVSNLAAQASKEKAQAMLDALGLVRDATPDDYVRRLTMLEIGSVDPQIKRHHAVKVAEVAPLAFYRLTDEIMVLMGQGKLSESNASGTSPESGQASPSVPEAASEGAGSGSSTS